MDRRFVRKDGARVWIDLSVSLARKTSGEPDFFVCVAADITERKIGELVPDPLTHRELEVLRLMRRGYRNKQIAAAIGRTEATVKVHVLHILEKLAAADRTEAVTVALRRGIIHLDD